MAKIGKVARSRSTKLAHAQSVPPVAALTEPAITPIVKKRSLIAAGTVRGNPSASISMPIQTVTLDIETSHFKSVLAREPFTGLKAILENLSSDWREVRQAVEGGDSYQGLLARLGYRLILVN